MVRVIIADDHPLMREGIKRVVSGAGGMEVVAEAGDGDRLLAAVADVSADVVLLDISMPGMGCLEILRRLRAEHARLGVVVLTAHAEEGYAVRMLRAGASAFLTKGCPPAELTEAIRRAAEGRRYVSASTAEKLADALGGDAAAPHAALSDREFEVLRLMAKGLGVKQIAARLGISPKTVGTYRSRIREKLGVRSFTEALRYALREGLDE